MLPHLWTWRKDSFINYLPSSQEFRCSERLSLSRFVSSCGIEFHLFLLLVKHPSRYVLHWIQISQNTRQRRVEVMRIMHYSENFAHSTRPPGVLRILGPPADCTDRGGRVDSGYSSLGSNLVSDSFLRLSSFSFHFTNILDNETNVFPLLNTGHLPLIISYVFKRPKCPVIFPMDIFLSLSLS